MILVVEDSDLITDWLRHVIQDSGYYFDSAIDVASALYKISGIRYSMVLIDINLKGVMSGDHLAAIVKQLPDPINLTPLVAMTGGAALESEILKLFRHVLYKPFLPRDLREIIHLYADPPAIELHPAKRAVEEKPCT